MRKSIAIAGTITVDEISLIDSFPNESELININETKRSLGGLVANCAKSLSKIDGFVPIELVALIGQDDKGEYIKQRIDEYKNIDATQLIQVGTTPFTYVMENESNNTRTFFTNRGNSILFDNDTIDFSTLNSKLLHIGYLLLLDQLDSEDPVYGTKMARLLKEAKEHGIKTSIDVVSEASDRYKKIIPPSLAYTDYCIINELEAGKIVDINLRHDDGRLINKRIKETLIKLKSMGVNEWIIIHAPEGSFGYDGNNVYSIPSIALEKEQIKGTVGAGDAFAAGVLYGIYKDLSLKKSMKLAIASATALLLKRDCSSGANEYEELVKMYETWPKNKEVVI